MGALSPHGIQQRADKAIACLYGQAVANGKIDFTDVDASVAGLDPGFYVISNPDGEAFIRVNAAATTDGASQYLGAGASIAQWLGTPGTATFALHVIARTAGAVGTIFYTRLDDTEP